MAASEQGLKVIISWEESLSAQATALGGVLECSYLRQHFNLIKDSIAGIVLGNEDVFVRMSFLIEGTRPSSECLSESF